MVKLTSRLEIPATRIELSRPDSPTIFRAVIHFSKGRAVTLTPDGKTYDRLYAELERRGVKGEAIEYKRVGDILEWVDRDNVIVPNTIALQLMRLSNNASTTLRTKQIYN